jgi:hypothetical protein
LLLVLWYHSPDVDLDKENIFQIANSLTTTTMMTIDGA